MRIVLAILITALAGVGCIGCKSNNTNGKAPPPTYFDPAAAEEAMRQAQMVVRIRGDVRNAIIPWSEDLTLAGALVEAEFIGRWQPLSVTVTRGRKVQRFSASALLSGKDMFLQPGDLIQINR